MILLLIQKPTFTIVLKNLFVCIKLKFNFLLTASYIYIYLSGVLAETHRSLTLQSKMFFEPLYLFISIVQTTISLQKYFSSFTQKLYMGSRQIKIKLILN